MNLAAAILPASAHAAARPGQAEDLAASLPARAPFAGALQRAEQSPQEDVRLRTASRDLVSFSLLLPLLKQVRNDPFRGDLFHGGAGEDTFGGELDREIAQRLAARLDLSVGKAVYEQLRGATAAKAVADG